MDLYAIAKTPHTAKRPAELSLSIGDRIKITKQGPKNWIGTLNGKVGSFPAECVEVEKGAIKQRLQEPVRPNSSYSPAPSKTGTAPVQRSRSNYIPSGQTTKLPPPMNFIANAPNPLNLPPPPVGLVPNSPVIKKFAPPPTSLPSFNDVAGLDDEPTAPPRSPPRLLTISDLPKIPERPKTEPNNPKPAEEQKPAVEEPTPVDTPPSDDNGGQKKRTKDELRKQCITEIYQTEKDYIDDLETMIDVFIFPLRTMEIATEQVLYSIFSNVEVLIHCNKEMLKALEEVIGDKTGGDIQIGGVFTKLADYFKMYKVFCANQQQSLSAVDQQVKKNPQFKKNLDVCHSDPRCRGLFLQSFLIKPIQRVCKYPLLLRELIRYTPEDHPDHADLQSAFEKINEVVANINEGQRQAEGLQRIIDLQKLIDGVDTLVAPGRNLQKEGDLNFFKSHKSKHSEKRHVFFFSDLVLLSIKKGEKKFEHKLSVSLENCTLTVLADSAHIKNSFELVQGEKKHAVKCILGCDTPKECHEWVRNIKGLIKEYQKRKYNELKKLQEQGLTIINH